MTPPEVWAGVESSHLRVAGRWVDQLDRTGLRADPTMLGLATRLGARAVRCPILWGWPDGQPSTDWAWAEDAIGTLEADGVRPIVELMHHGSGPDGTSFLDRDAVPRFAEFAADVARRFPAVRAFLPLNEPLTTARFAALYGWWEPHVRDHRLFVRMLLGQCLAIREATRALRAMRPGVIAIATEDVGRTRGTPGVRAAVRFDNARRWLTFDLLAGRVGPRHPLWRYLTDDRQNRALVEELARDPAPPDVIGLDYYVTSDRFLDHHIERYPPASHGGDGRLRYADVELVRAHPRGIVGHRGVIGEAWRRYRLPLALTEVHLDGAEADRAAWWDEAWQAARDASAAGIPVLGVTAWAILGAAGWAGLMTGDVLPYAPGAFDARTRPPRLTGEGDAILRSAAGERSWGRRRGWWRQPGRLTYESREVRPAATASGASGAGTAAASEITSSKSASQRGTTTAVA